MKKTIILLYLFAFSCVTAIACDDAILRKVYPIGICSDTIISIDFKIERGMLFSDLDKITNDSIRNNYKPAPSIHNWYIKSYITKYDKYQNILDIVTIDSMLLHKSNCEEELESIYKKTYQKIIKENKNIKLFNLFDIKFGNFDNKDKDAELRKHLISYKEELYPEEETEDLIGNNPILKKLFKLINDVPLGSVRQYTLNNIELIVIHIQFGQFYEIEDKPKLECKHISEVFYMEPILYHGDGSDHFFIRKKG